MIAYGCAAHWLLATRYPRSALAEAIVSKSDAAGPYGESKLRGRGKVTHHLCLLGSACGLRSAGLRARRVSICIHLLVKGATWLRVRQHRCHLSVYRL